MQHLQTIEHHRTSLLGIVASLLVIVGGQLRVFRRVRIDVLRILRPAETAVRRLIVVLANDAVLKSSQPRLKPKSGSVNLPAARATPKTYAFALADPMPPMMPDQKTRAQGAQFLRAIPPLDPTVTAVFEAHRIAHQLKLRSQHRAEREATRAEALAARFDDGKVDAARLSLRLEAVRAALSDLPRQAQRLLRWKARRERASQQRPTYISPIRPGPPPYLKADHRQRFRHEVEDILFACHGLVREIRMNSS
jgi:hypothetical protein